MILIHLYFMRGKIIDSNYKIIIMNRVPQRDELICLNAQHKRRVYYRVRDVIHAVPKDQEIETWAEVVLTSVNAYPIEHGEKDESDTMHKGTHVLHPDIILDDP